MVSIAVLNTQPDLGSGVDLNGREGPFRAIDGSQFSVLHALFTNNASVRAAYETICRFMFAGGVVVDKEDFELEAAIAQVLNSAWLRFARDCLESLLKYGFVIVGFNSRKTPFVWDAIELSIEFRRRSTGDREYRLFRNKTAFMGRSTMREPLKDVIVFESAGPDSRGHLRSILRSLGQLESFRNLMLACSARAEQRRSQPPIVTEHLPKDVNALTQARDMSAFGDASVITMSEEEKRRVREAAGLARVEALVRAHNQGLYLQGQEQLPTMRPELARMDPITGTPQFPLEQAEEAYAHSRVFVETGRKVANVPLAESPTFLMELLDREEADVSKVLGVPRGLFSSNSAERVNDTLLNTFYATLQEHRVKLQQIFTVCLECAYGEANFKHMMRHLDPRRPIEEQFDKHHFRVAFPGLLDPEILDSFMDRGTMTWDAYRQYTARYYGINSEDLAERRVEPSTGYELRSVVDRERKMQEIALRAQIQAKQAPAGSTNSVPRAVADLTGNIAIPSVVEGATAPSSSADIGQSGKRSGPTSSIKPAKKRKKQTAGQQRADSAGK